MKQNQVIKILLTSNTYIIEHNEFTFTIKILFTIFC